MSSLLKTWGPAQENTQRNLKKSGGALPTQRIFWGPDPGDSLPRLDAAKADDAFLEFRTG